MAYILENKTEAERLERQSLASQYLPAEELVDFQLKPGQSVLDAGCGSGLLSRMLHGRFPQAQVFGVDGSAERIADAKKLSKGQGVDFSVANLLEPLPRKFDHVVSRFVIEHVSHDQQLPFVKNLKAALKPGGELWLIDIDGYLLNLFPRTAFLEECLGVFAGLRQIDLCVGRKMPHLMAEAGFEKIRWRIQTMTMNTPEQLQEEVGLIRERFENTLGAMGQILGSEKKAQEFQDRYLEQLSQPGTVLFYNKFIVSGVSPVAHLKSI